ncbi:MAG: V-type ATP synthase subunit A, partial [Clostridiales bacterium]|nr:V-type ATP synthase subunit A [Clostridiales bacterium]
PVSQSTMRIVKVFWSLDSSLAYARHFPAINWLSSYSLYVDRLSAWFNTNIGRAFMENRNKALQILQTENELNEIVKLVGLDALSPADRLTMETARMIREDFLQQNSFSETDSYTTHDKQFRLLSLILLYDRVARAALSKGADMNSVFAIPARERIGRAKDVSVDEYVEVYASIEKDINEQIAGILNAAGQV